jgi:aminopeptidase N
MENISLVTWIDTFVIDQTNALERKHLTDLVNIHEMGMYNNPLYITKEHTVNHLSAFEKGHTYFGDLLVIRHFEHAWLKESWATYIESCKSLKRLLLYIYY